MSSGLPPRVWLTLAFALVFVVGRPAAAQYRIDTWTTEQGLPQNSIFQVLQTPDGFLWISTFGGLARFDGLGFRVFDTTTNPEMPNSRLAGLRVDGEGRLWVITQDRFLMRTRRLTVCPTTTSAPRTAIAKARSGWPPTRVSRG